MAAMAIEVSEELKALGDAGSAPTPISRSGNGTRGERRAAAGSKLGHQLGGSEIAKRSRRGIWLAVVSDNQVCRGRRHRGCSNPDALSPRGDR